MKTREVTVTFSVQGYVKQNVVILDKRVTPESLQRGLNDGTYFTTVQEGEDICDVHGRTVARVESLSTKSDLEYTDFSVDLD